MLKVRVRDTAALNDLLSDRISALDGVRSTKTTIVLRTAKETSTIPIAGADAMRSREAGDDDR
jgi:DNA-binding Lrp family transcriptional regulator